jgi:hypothetical protein
MKKIQGKPEVKAYTKPEKVKGFSSTQKIKAIKEYAARLEEDKEFVEDKKDNSPQKLLTNGQQLEDRYTEEEYLTSSSNSEVEKKDEEIKKPAVQIDQSRRSNLYFLKLR